MSRLSSLSDWILRLPLVWGGLACMAFYALISQGWMRHAIVVRYFASHPVEYVTTALFFVALAALVMRLSNLTIQHASFARNMLPPIPAGGQPVEEAELLLCDLSAIPDFAQQSYVVRRLRDALEFVHRKNTADTLDDHLRYLEEADAVRMAGGYATVRIIVWAIPILGFLGTVIGITLAIAKLSPDQLVNSLTDVTSGLGVAFDTTALALALSIVLMFCKDLVERVEDRLLAKVDARATEELTGRFHSASVDSDPNIATIRRMSQQVIEAVETMTARQAQLWKSTIDDSHQQWAEVTATAGEILENALETSVETGLEKHAATLKNSTQEHAEVLKESTEKIARAVDSGTARHRECVEKASHDLGQAFRTTAQEHQQRLTEATSQQIATLSEGVRNHADTLRQGVADTTARLRDGLEKLAELLVEALEKHGESLTRSERELAAENRQHLSEVEAALGEAMVVSADRQENLIKRSEQLLQEMQQALVDAASRTVEQQRQLVRQGDVLLKVVDATSQIKQLETSLNDNLASLHGTHNFEETLVSLSAAIQLLSARLGKVSPHDAPLSLGLDESTSSAA